MFDYTVDFINSNNTNCNNNDTLIVFKKWAVSTGKILTPAPNFQ